MKVKYKKLDNFISPPVRAYRTDAGADVFSPDTYLIPPGSRMAIPLGFALEIPEGYMGIIVTKSSTFKKGLYSISDTLSKTFQILPDFIVDLYSFTICDKFIGMS